MLGDPARRDTGECLSSTACSAGVRAESLAIVIWESSVSMQERLVAYDDERISQTEEFPRPDR